MGAALIVTPWQRAAPDRHGVAVLRDFRAEPAQNVQHAAVALRGLQIQPLDGHALFRQRTMQRKNAVFDQSPSTTVCFGR